MKTKFKIKKGLDIPLAGAARETLTPDRETSLFAIIPSDFGGYTWKAAVHAGDMVKIGTPLLRAKEDDRLCLVSPVGGTISEISRGERRKIEYISVERKGDQMQETFEGTLIERLMKAGLFAQMRQRPFDTVPDTAKRPRDIFVTAFDSSPLAASFTKYPLFSFLEEGLKALATLTGGKVYLGVPMGSGIVSNAAQVMEFEGPHPAGNVGTQIAAIAPVNKGETVWALDAISAARIGKFAATGNLDWSANVALTGPCVKDPHIVETTIGAKLETLLNDSLDTEKGKVRVISGNVLTGWHEQPETGFLHWPYRQITVIEEGDTADEFMGWASLNPGKYSVKRSFPAFLRGLRKPFRFDARVKGGHRAMILSGEYDKVFPMDILPEYLVKAIMAKDIEKMEQLGIYEVAPEDFALAEFVDTSKIELQKIVAEGLDYLRKETL